MAIDFPASPTNGQTFTSGSVTYTWDGTKWTAVAAAGSSNSISQGNTNATVTDTGSDGRFVVTTEGSERLRVDSSGRLGIGTSTPDDTLHLVGATGYGLKNTDGTHTVVLRTVSGGGILKTASNHALVFGTNDTERFRCDNAGRLLVGTTSARSNINHRGIAGITPNVQFETATGSYNGGLSIINNSGAGYAATLTLGVSHGTTIGSNTLGSSGSQTGTISFSSSDGTNFIDCAQVRAEIDGTPGTNDMPGRLVFSTTADGASSPTERMRIRQSGATSLRSGIGDCLNLLVATAADSTETLLSGFHTSSNVNSGTASIRIRTNGNVVNTNNSYGSLSDLKLKENIIDATSQWDDLKALQVRKYNFKEETGQETHTQIGLIAQEVELVSPGLVSESPDRDEDGNDLGTVTKSVNYSVLYMKAVKALQEAMARIETLEAKVAALESA